MELLEKRVKSRFSHRQLHLLPGLSFNEYIQMFISYLSLPANFKHKKYAKEWNKNLQVHVHIIVFFYFDYKKVVNKIYKDFFAVSQCQ